MLQKPPVGQNEQLENQHIDADGRQNVQIAQLMHLGAADDGHQSCCTAGRVLAAKEVHDENGRCNRQGSTPEGITRQLKYGDANKCRYKVAGNK